MSDTPPPPETYLGDGLYASFDGYAVKLRAPHLDREHVVFLEQSVYVALLQFVKDISRG